MPFEWPYFELVDGRLHYLNGRGQLRRVVLPESPVFKDAAEAEEWLKANGLRGNVR
jgi:hypothetical protein